MATVRPIHRLSILVAICAVAIFASTTVAASVYTAAPRCDGVRLRTGPSTSQPTKAVIDREDIVTVDAEVDGSRWSTLCGGRTYSGSTWARVTAVDGESTAERYEVAALYVAAGLLIVLEPTARPSGAATSRPSPTLPAPTASPSAPPSPAPASPSRPPITSPTPTASATPVAAATASPPATTPAVPGSGAVDGLGGFGAAGQMAVLILALASVTLAWIAYRDRKRSDDRRYMANVPSGRLDDVLRP